MNTALILLYLSQFCLLQVAFAKNVSPITLINGERRVQIESTKYEKRDAKRVILDIASILEMATDDGDDDGKIAKRSYMDRPMNTREEAAVENDLSKRPLTTTVSLNPKTSIFSEYCRNVMPLYTYLDDFDDDSDKDDKHRSDYQFLVFTPVNAAVQKLNKKPWEYPISITKLEEHGANESEIADAIQQNTNKFVYDHVVLLNDQKDADTLSGNAAKLMEKNYLELKTLSGETITLVHDSTERARFYVKSPQNAKMDKIHVLDYGCYRNGCVFVTEDCLEDF